MDIFDEVAKAIAQDKSFAEVFTPEIIDRLAELNDAQYDVFKVQLEAHLILSGTEMDGLKNLDKLVRAARARLDEKRSRLPRIPLKEQLPDAPHTDKLFVPSGWVLAADGIYLADAEGVPDCRVCTSPVYIAGKEIDPDRRKTRLILAVKTGEWRTTVVPATFLGKKVASVVTDMGALVLDAKAFSMYWDDFLQTNFETLPVKDADCGLYEELITFVNDNLHQITDNKWGKIVNGKDGDYLALKPEVARRFAKAAGVDFDHLLASLRENDLLLSDGNSRLKTVWFNGRARRMVAVVWSEHADGSRAEQNTTTEADRPRA